MERIKKISMMLFTCFFMMCLLCGCETVYDKPIEENEVKSVILNECLSELSGIPNCRDEGLSGFEEDLELVEVIYDTTEDENKRVANVTFKIPSKCFNDVFEVCGNAQINYELENSSKWVAKQIDYSFRFKPIIMELTGLWVSYGLESFVCVDFIDWYSGNVVFCVDGNSNKKEEVIRGRVLNSNSGSDNLCVNSICSNENNMFNICENFFYDGPEYYGDICFQYNGVEYHKIDDDRNATYDDGIANSMIAFMVGNTQIGNATAIMTVGYENSYSTNEIVGAVQVDLSYDFTEVLRDYVGQELTVFYRGKEVGRYPIDDIDPFMTIMVSGNDGRLSGAEFNYFKNLLYYGSFYMY